MKYVYDVAIYVGELLIDLHETLNIPLKDNHLIGHSLEAYISVLAGIIYNKIKRNEGRE